MTDESLMLAVKDGDLEQAGGLFDRYHKRIYNFLAKTTLDREVAHDLTQNVFLRLIKYRNTYREGMSFQPWVFQMARNVFADHYRKKKLSHASFVAVENLGGELADGQENAFADQQEQLLYAAMAKLAYEDRELLVMSRFMKMKYDEVAAVTGLSVSNVKVKIHRIIKRLRKHYFELEKT